MSKKYRVKRYYGKASTSYRAKPHPVSIILTIVLFAGLGYLGTIIYKPASEFIMNIGKQPEIVEILPEIPASVPEPAETPEPEAAPKPEYESLKAVYIPHDIAIDSARLDEALDALSGTRINAVMIDIKNPEGEVLFKSKNEMAVKWGVITSKAIDLKAFSKKLEDRNLSLITKLSAFRDPKAASAGRLAYAVNYQNSDYLWLDAAPDNGGKPWLNPYSLPTQDYIDSLALESVDAGAKMVVLENVQFPDNSGVYATFGKDAVTISRAEILKMVVTDLSQHAEKKNARVAVYFPVTAAAAQEGQENRYGGNILKIPDEYVMLGVQPSQFGKSYSSGGLEITESLENPGAAVETSINYAKQGLSNESKIIPMLQGGNDGTFNSTKPYTAEQVNEQIAAAEKLGLDEYILYNADGAYLFK